MSQATAMLDAFGSVGAFAVDVTHTEFPHGNIVAYRPNVAIDRFRLAADQIVARATHEMRNVIIRPRSETVLTQLDDLDADKLARVEPFAFLAYRTSPDSYQAWTGQHQSPRSSGTMNG